MQFYQCSIITLYFSQFQDLTGSAVPIEFVATSRLPAAHGE
ncbi:GTP cyclohydrolase II, partial [Yersinia pestis]